MKTILFFFIAAFFISSCGSDDTERLRLQLDSLKRNSYSPGFGEFMSAVQVHHAKLWFAGINENWELADFEINEIKETLSDLQKYRIDRKESQMVIMLNPAIDSVSMSIRQKNPALFKSAFASLTNTCNSCHVAVNYSFNVVKIPDAPPFSNQDFKSGAK